MLKKAKSDAEEKTLRAESNKAKLQNQQKEFETKLQNQQKEFESQKNEFVKQMNQIKLMLEPMNVNQEQPVTNENKKE